MLVGAVDQRATRTRQGGVGRPIMSGVSTQRSNFDTGDIERVLAATDIVRLVSQHVAVKKKGREYVSICPFHDDHSPSMTISPGKQIYKCFSCGAGGDALKFVREYHKMSFREALEYLADRCGVKLTPYKRGMGGVGAAEEMGTPGVSRDELAQANRFALDFYRMILRHAEHGAAARGILEKRGVSAEMIERFQLGASPDRWDGLALMVNSKQMDPAPFIGAGLIRNRESGGGAFDMQRNRVMFPIFDLLGRVIAFGGRRIDDQDEPKYINSSESALFNKSATLYGLNLAAEEIRRTHEAIVVEGYMDVIACHQAGVTNVIATLGTALTAQSARVLSRLCDKVVLFFDGDDAGQRAADRAVEVFFASTLDVRIASLATARATGETTAKDADELVKQPGGVELLRKVIAGATDALEYRFARMKARLSTASSTQRASAVTEELRRLADLGLANLNPVRRQMVIKRISELAGVRDEAIRQMLAEMPAARAARGAADTQEGAEPARAAALPPQSAAEFALAFLLAEPSLWRNVKLEERDVFSAAELGRVDLAPLVQTLLTHDEQADAAAITRALRAIDDEAAADAYTTFIATIERTYGEDLARLSSDFASSLSKARAELLERRALRPGLSLDLKVKLQRDAKMLRQQARAGPSPGG